MNILVIGCGPAGLLAAWLATLRGHRVSIVSKRVKSPLGGAQYLHRALPGVTLNYPEAWVEINKSGTREGYAKKVYGDPHAPVSWDSRYQAVQTAPAWDVKRVYDDLWEYFEHKIDHWEVDGSFVGSIAPLYDLTFNSIPRRAICQNPNHTFLSQPIWVRPQAEALGNNFIHMNGDEETPWYRTSRIFGRGMTEWSGETAEEGVFKIHKPLRTDCNCWEGKIVPIGRFGIWSKDPLISDVLEVVEEQLT